ncbi:MAG TPA: sialate O-acetylesterase [Cyclobacteriaceae bacterium]
MKRILITVLSVAVLTVQAQIKLPRIFGDHMILQRDHTITIWGWAGSKEKVTVQLNNQKKTVAAGNDGKWKLVLDAMKAGGPYQLTVKGKNTITLNDVWMGDVWVCSGQSNMEWTVNNSYNAAKEIQHANYPQIRHFKVPNTIASTPSEDVTSGEWMVCTPTTVGDFTAVGYFFARKIVMEVNVPIGLINTSWGGTHSETWTSREAFEGSEEFKSMIASMPKLNLDSLSKQNTAKTKKRIEALQGSLDVSTEAISKWKTASYDHASWPTMNIPGRWEQQELGELDGVVWLRKVVILPGDQAGKEGVLDLEMIDDSDETYINGEKIGETWSKWNEKRSYRIPAALLKEGKNVIAVRVEDTGGGGGIHGDADQVKITLGGQTQTLSGAWSYHIESISSNTGVGPNSYPTLLYNAMVKPLIPFAIKGALWYQGESNAGRAYQYRKAFPLMITDWRKQWNQGDFPFYFVQLASFNAGNGNSQVGSDWAELREAQALTLTLPNTGMAVTTDIGDPFDIHPRNKQDVGKRLAAVALKNTYGKSVEDAGPTYQSMKVEGNKVIISFTHANGLMTTDKYGYLKGFEVAGEDQKFYYAKAFIEGDHVILYSDVVSKPVAVRFGWADDASEDNLFNKEGFPAVPFRTDNWKGITEKERFVIGN